MSTSQHVESKSATIQRLSWRKSALQLLLPVKQPHLKEMHRGPTWRCVWGPLHFIVACLELFYMRIHK